MSVVVQRPEFSERSIIHCLVGPFAMFPPRRNLCVDNVCWGMGLPWEADLLVMSGSGYLTEVEVKISVADLKRDAGKRKHGLRLAENGSHYNTLIRRFYYAMPEAVWQQAGDKLVPPDAGIILISINHADPDTHILPTLVSRVVKAPIANSKAKKLGMRERYDLARLGTLRYWR